MSRKRYMKWLWLKSLKWLKEIDDNLFPLVIWGTAIWLIYEMYRALCHWTGGFVAGSIVWYGIGVAGAVIWPIRYRKEIKSSDMKEALMCVPVIGLFGPLAIGIGAIPFFL